MNPVLVDTSVWIRFLRGDGTRETGMLELLIETGAAAVCGVVLCELYPLGGSIKVRQEADRFFRSLPVLPDPPELWKTVTGMRTACVTAGVKGIGLPDLVVAAVAVHNSAALLSMDSHFQQIRTAGTALSLAG